MIEALIAAGAAIAGSITTAVQNRKMRKRQEAENEKNRQFALHQQEKQVQDSKQMLKESDSYKVQSLKNAGLNPAIAYGGSAPVITPSIGNSANGSVAPQMDLGDSIRKSGAGVQEAYQSAQRLVNETALTDAQVDNLEAEAESKRADTNIKVLDLKHQKDRDAVIEKCLQVYGQTGSGQVAIDLGTTKKVKFTDAEGIEHEFDQPDAITVDSDMLTSGLIEGLTAVLGNRVNVSESQAKTAIAGVQAAVAEAQKNDPETLKAMQKQALATYNSTLANTESTKAGTASINMEMATNLKNLVLQATENPGSLSLGQWLFLGVSIVGCMIGGRPDLLFGGKSKGDKPSADTQAKLKHQSEENEKNRKQREQEHKDNIKTKRDIAAAQIKARNAARSATGVGNSRGANQPVKPRKTGKQTTSFND